MFHSQVGDLLCPCPGVVEEQEQGTVPLDETPRSGEVPEQGLDLVALEEVRLCGCRPLHRDCCHPLADAEHLRLSAGDVVEQGTSWDTFPLPRSALNCSSPSSPPPMSA